MSDLYQSYIAQRVDEALVDDLTAKEDLAASNNNKVVRGVETEEKEFEALIRQVEVRRGVVALVRVVSVRVIRVALVVVRVSCSSSSSSIIIVCCC